MGGPVEKVPSGGVRMSQKYQKEIEEILKQAGELEPSRRTQKPKESIWRLIWLYVCQSLGGKRLSLSAGRVMLVAVCLLLSALIVRAAVPGLMAPLAWAGLLLFLVGYGMFFVKPPKIEKRWRGQPLDGSGDSWWDRFRRKLK